MLFNNQRTCSTVGKKKHRQLEGHDLEVNLNPILSMDRPPCHPATGVTPLYAFFMSNRPDKGIAFKSHI